MTKTIKKIVSIIRKNNLKVNDIFEGIDFHNNKITYKTEFGHGDEKISDYSFTIDGESVEEWLRYSVIRELDDHGWIDNSEVNEYKSTIWEMRHEGMATEHLSEPDDIYHGHKIYLLNRKNIIKYGIEQFLYMEYFKLPDRDYETEKFYIVSLKSMKKLIDAIQLYHVENMEKKPKLNYKYQDCIIRFG